MTTSPSKKKKEKDKGFGSTTLSVPPRRLRRPSGQTNFNLTTTKDHFQALPGDGYKDPTKVMKVRQPGEFKYVVQRLLESGSEGALLPDPKARTVRDMSVWRKQGEIRRDFLTTTEVDFEPSKLEQGSPRTVMLRRDEMRHAAGQVSEARQGERDEALAAFRGIVATQYGNATKLFKAVKKTKEDTVDTEEFENLMLRLNLDGRFPKARQEALLEALPQIHGSGVSVSDIIAAVDAGNNNPPKQRAQTAMPSNSHRPRIGTGFGPAATLTTASVDLMLTAPHDLTGLLDDTFVKPPTQEATAAFASYLQQSSIPPDQIPFFGQRAEPLNWRRVRAGALADAVDDPAIHARMRVWQENKQKAKEIDAKIDAQRMAKLEKRRNGVEEVFVHPLGPKPKPAPQPTSNQDDDWSSDDDAVGAAPAAGGPGLDKENLPNHSQQLRPPRAQSAPVKAADKAAARAAARSARRTLEPLAKTTAAAAATGSADADADAAGDQSLVIYDATQSMPSDFLATFASSTKTKLEGPDKTLITVLEPAQMESREPLVRPTAKRMAPRVPSDFSRIGVGSHSTLYHSVDGLPTADVSNEPGKRSVWQQSVTSDYFPELIYQPSKPVSRNLVSDSAKELERKKASRQARYDKGMKQWEGTLKRLEDFEFDKHIKGLYNTKARNEDLIRFESTVFHSDVRRFRTQPLNAMTLRPNTALSRPMWSGNEGAVNDKPTNHDQRDFATTTHTSFVDNTMLRKSTSALFGAH